MSKEQILKLWHSRGWLRTYFGQFLSGKITNRLNEQRDVPLDIIFSVANHFEPKVRERGLKGGIESVVRWCKDQAEIEARDIDGHPFKHTYYFPAEQYVPELLEPLEEHCQKKFGEVEIHLHHGQQQPDTAENLTNTLTDFIAKLRSHGFLSYDSTDQFKSPCYCFVHGNWALANSCGGKFCGVDNELQILAETGCYLDCTMPSAPDISQVSKINSIYLCGLPLNERIPHRSGKDLRVGEQVSKFPVLLQGPLVINWKRKKKGFFYPAIENGTIDDFSPPSMERFLLWVSANVHVKRRPNWVFVKLHTHSLQDDHANSIKGRVMKNFLSDLLCSFNDGKRFRIHFTSSRESANIILAALDGQEGNPNQFRDYRFKLFST